MQRIFVFNGRWHLARLLGWGSICLFTLGGLSFADEGGRATLRIRFGMKDQEPTDWSGKLLAGSAKVESIRGWRWVQNDSAKGDTWSVRTRRQNAQGAAQRKRVAAGLKLPISDNGILVTLSGCKDDQPIQFDTKPLQAKFTLSQIPFGQGLVLGAGNLVIERVPSIDALAATMADEDYPATATAKDGTVYAVYLSFTRGRDFQGPREQPATQEAPASNLGTPVRMIEQPADLIYLAQPTGGEQIYLRIYRDHQWGEPIAVTDGRHEMYRPAVSVDGNGRVWVFYSAHLDADKNLDYGNWELMGRSFAADGSDPGQPVNLSQTAGTDFMPAAATDANGRVWVTWVGGRETNFHVFAAHQTADGFSQPQRVSQFTGNEWEPAIATDGKGNLAIAWDSFEKGDYDVYVATAESDGKLSSPQAVAASLAFEVRPSLAYDGNGRLWIAYEYSGDQWGKDFGALKKVGIPLYQTGRSLQVKVRDSGGNWFVPPDVMEAMPTANPAGRVGARKNPNAPNRAAARQPNRGPITGIAPSYPRLISDGEGGLWLAFRGKPGSNWRVGVGTVWCEYVTRLSANGWSDAVWMPHSNNILDNRPALVAAGDGDVMIVFSGDGRGEVNPFDLEDVHLPGSSDDADIDAETDENAARPLRAGRRRDQADPNNNIMFSLIGGGAFGPLENVPDLEPIQTEIPAISPESVALEQADIRRMRDYRVKLGDESLQIWRGEFHRHTELSPDGGGDGGLLDMWRYAIDAAGMDWIGDGDHDYGNGREYSWWTTQKAVTLFTLPKHFVPVYSYERSVRYPEGHRNCMFAYRGVRSLPRLPISSPDKFAPAPDTNLLYMYLHYFGGICASHTSATDMGTDWRNNDPEVEPFVEIYQGDRNNYERPDAPRSAVTEAKLKQSTPDKESLGGWRPKGFVNLALLKGYRLAFQSSSDHISTHLSYCNVLVTEPTRKGIIDAIRKRRVYGATDNIVADVRCQVGDRIHFMGEEFTTPVAPTIDVHLIGARKIGKVTIIKDDVEVHVAEPNEKDVHFQWTDPNPSIGKTSYYYVRGEQVSDLAGASSGELVWASPMWICVKPD